MQICKYVSSQVFKYVRSMYVCNYVKRNYAIMIVYKYVSMQVGKYASMQVCM